MSHGRGSFKVVIASEQIEALCARKGASVLFKPVLFAGLLNHWGQRGPAEVARALAEGVGAWRTGQLEANRKGS